MTPRNIRIIDPAAIESNMRNIRAAVPPTSKVLGVVKADGYGHDAVKTAQACIRGGAEMLAVAAVKEGIQLRNSGISVPILVLGAVMEDDVQEGVEHELIQTVCSPEMIDMCENAAVKTGRSASVHIKTDTGMGRIGVRNELEMKGVITALEKCPHVQLKGAFTHFADADGDEDGIRYSREQFRRFLELTDPLPRNITRHCCNSAAIHRFPEMALDMVRAGISLYGYPPVKTEIPLKMCMAWKAKISYIKDLPAGSFVSYGRTYRNEETIRTATVTCGYADGYHRAAGKNGYVLIHGQRAKIIGRICMDQMMADITGISGVCAGDEVTLMGTDGSESISAEDIAGWAGTISYEILCSTGSRVDRVFKEG